MARRDDDQDGAPVPEADRLEQQQQAHPSIGPAQQRPDALTLDVDEADQLEQAHEFPTTRTRTTHPNPPNSEVPPSLPARARALSSTGTPARGACLRKYGSPLVLDVRPPRADRSDCSCVLSFAGRDVVPVRDGGSAGL